MFDSKKTRSGKKFGKFTAILLVEHLLWFGITVCGLAIPLKHVLLERLKSKFAHTTRPCNMHAALVTVFGETFWRGN